MGVITWREEQLMIVVLFSGGSGVKEGFGGGAVDATTGLSLLAGCCRRRETMGNMVSDWRSKARNDRRRKQYDDRSR